MIICPFQVGFTNNPCCALWNFILFLEDWVSSCPTLDYVLNITLWAVTKIYCLKRSLMQYQFQGAYLQWKGQPLCGIIWEFIHCSLITVKIINMNNGGTYSMKWTLIFVQLHCCWLEVCIYWNCQGKDKVIFFSCCQFWDILIILYQPYYSK